jgi:hypothetical protein
MKPINNKFFKIKPKQFKFFGRSVSKQYPVAEPSGVGIINVCDNFDWKNPGVVDEVPRVRLIEKELIYGSYTTSVLALIQTMGDLTKGLLGDPKGGADIYPQLYATKNTNFQYILPNLLTTGNNIQSLSNTWQQINSGPMSLVNSFSDGKSNKGSGMGEKFLEMGMSFSIGMGTPGFGFDDMYQYGGTQPRTISISFPLYNTLTVESAYQNYSFVNLFMFQNLKTRTSLATYIPPKLYVVDHMDTEGAFYSPLCIVSNYSVESIGTTRRMIEFRQYGVSDILMPEAYKVTIQLMEIVQNSSNIFSGSIGGDKIQVTNADPNRDLNGLLKDRNRVKVNDATKSTPATNPTSDTAATRSSLTEEQRAVVERYYPTNNNAPVATVVAQNGAVLTPEQAAMTPEQIFGL